MVATKRLVEALERLGLSTYEARAYAALVGSGAVNGYQLSRLSGVPRSRIYETLEKLIVRGVVVTRKARPQLYRAAPCEEVLARAAADMQQTHTTIRACCADMRSAATDDGVWNLTGRQPILSRATAMIQAAVRSVETTVMAAELRELEPALLAAETRGVRVRAVVCGEHESRLRHVLRHRFGSSRTGDIALIVDGSEALGGVTEPPETAAAAWSRADGFVHIAREYVLHEIFIARAFDSVDASAGSSLDATYRAVFEDA